MFSVLFLGQCVYNSFPSSAEAHFLLSFAYPAADANLDLERTIRKNRCTPTSYQAIFAHHQGFLDLTLEPIKRRVYRFDSSDFQSPFRCETPPNYPSSQHHNHTCIKWTLLPPSPPFLPPVKIVLRPQMRRLGVRQPTPTVSSLEMLSFLMHLDDY